MQYNGCRLGNYSFRYLNGLFTYFMIFAIGACYTFTLCCNLFVHVHDLHVQCSSSDMIMFCTDLLYILYRCLVVFSSQMKLKALSIWVNGFNALFGCLELRVRLVFSA